jgi:polyferredoxin
MEKIGKPKGLVRYDTEHNMELRTQGHNPELHLLRPRTIYYTLLIAAVGTLMLVALLFRSPLEIHAIHDRNPLFVMMSDGKIRNGYDIKILNKLHEEARFSLSVEGIENAELVLQSSDGSTLDDMKVMPDSIGHFRVFIMSDAVTGHDVDIVFHVKNTISGVTDDISSVFIAKMER